MVSFPGIGGKFGPDYAGARVVEALERLKTCRGVPDALRNDNGPEFISHVLAEWVRIME